MEVFIKYCPIVGTTMCNPFLSRSNSCKQIMYASVASEAYVKSHIYVETCLYTPSPHLMYLHISCICTSHVSAESWKKLNSYN